ncbi:FecCD family ABC transporter permease [Enterococcus hirae]|uniref:FecCD family ABC transporter permease n=1 Tax=Enterococcus hirae TaxID=1354 RepID=UPI001A963DFF|nr:iron ABC transporter permease [Enterococcus hirae]MBO1101164.1 iron ABC transporter permease [Enterococcus hirae]
MKRSYQSLVVLFVLLVVSIVASLMIGTPFIPFDQLAEVFQGKGSAIQELIVYEFRAPRLLISLLAGMCLGISGFILQGVTRNRLADAGILGINAGAGFFVMIYLGFYANQTFPFLLLIVAFLGGLLAALLVYLFAYMRNSFLGMNRLLLSGIAVNAGLSALMLLFTIKLSKENYGFVNAWLAGSLWGASWPYVFSLLPWAAILLPFVLIYSRRIGLLSFGQERAQSLGLDVQKSQKILLILAVALACGSVAVAGSLSFVGLLAPHLAKFVVRRENQLSLILSGLFGAFFVTLADVLTRVILPSGEIPTGILIAVLGAPYFLYLLFSKQTIA